MRRRTVLKLVVHGIGAVVTLGLAVPLVVFGLSPGLTRRRGAQRWAVLGPVDGFAVGETVRAAAPLMRGDWSAAPEAKGVYVRRTAEGDLAIFSRQCTDLSCPVTWDPGSACFYCPCHGGIFDAQGEPMAGPPPRGLYRYRHRVREGMLEIDLNSVPAMA